MDAVAIPEASLSAVQKVGGSLRNARIGVLEPAGVESDGTSNELVEPAPRAKPVNRPSTSKSAIVYSASQRKNPVLALIKNVPIEVGDIQADYQVGATTGVLFLSLRYQRLHPEYLHTRIEKLQGIYLLRILLVLCDVTEHHQSLREITKTCLINNMTVFVAWTNEEAANYLQIFKASENKSADSLKERIHQSYHAQLENCLTSGKKIQKPDVWSLAGNLGSFASIANASPQQLSVLPGLGPVKVKSLHDAFTQPFKVVAQSSSKETALKPSESNEPETGSLPSDGSAVVPDSPWQDPLEGSDSDGESAKASKSDGQALKEHRKSRPPFLSRFLPPCPDPSRARPHITLTYAQSSDGKIAGPGGARVAISGAESMEMTHWMRTMHDSIMIGIGTLLLDDPRLQVTGLPPTVPQPPPPQPLILDPQLRFPLRSRMLAAWQGSRVSGDGQAKQPWLVCGRHAAPGRLAELEEAGARVIRVALDDDGRIPASQLPEIMQDLELQSLMIEGGSQIISSVLKATRAEGDPVADVVIVTIAPMVIGDGVSVLPEAPTTGLPALKALYSQQLGSDWVIVCKPTEVTSTLTYEDQMIGMLSSMAGDT